MNCESCNNPMSKVHGQSHHHCKPCNLFAFPTDMQNSEEPIEPQGKTTDFQCPKCVVSLEVGIIHGNSQVCFCNNCRGFVTSTESLGSIINNLRRDYQGEDDRPVAIDPKELDDFDECPACLTRMDSHPYYGPGNVVLNTCIHCKLAWLDHGELAKIIRAPGPRLGKKEIGSY